MYIGETKSVTTLASNNRPKRIETPAPVATPATTPVAVPA